VSAVTGWRGRRRRELERGVEVMGRERHPGAGRLPIDKTQPGLTAALEQIPHPIRCRPSWKSKAKLAAARFAQGWKVGAPQGAERGAGLRHALPVVTRGDASICGGEGVCVGARATSSGARSSAHTS